jgi:hypothetical protein
MLAEVGQGKVLDPCRLVRQVKQLAKLEGAAIYPSFPFLDPCRLVRQAGGVISRSEGTGQGGLPRSLTRSHAVAPSIGEQGCRADREDREDDAGRFGLLSGDGEGRLDGAGGRREVVRIAGWLCLASVVLGVVAGAAAPVALLVERFRHTRSPQVAGAELPVVKAGLDLSKRYAIAYGAGNGHGTGVGYEKLTGVRILGYLRGKRPERGGMTWICPAPE